MKNTLLMMPMMRSGTIVRTIRVATKNTAPVKASMFASVMWVSPTSIRRLTTASKVRLLGSRPSCSRISSIRRLRVTAAMVRSRMVLGSKLLGLFIIGLTSIRGRRPDDGKLAFDSSIGQDWSDMKRSQPGRSGLDFRRLRRKKRYRIFQYILGRYCLHGDVSDLKIPERAIPILRTSPGRSAAISASFRADIYYALLGQVLAIPPIAAEGLNQGRGIAQACGG